MLKVSVLKTIEVGATVVTPVVMFARIRVRVSVWVNVNDRVLVSVKFNPNPGSDTYL
jgi:hypothetical protein